MQLSRRIRKEALTRNPVDVHPPRPACLLNRIVVEHVQLDEKTLVDAREGVDGAREAAGEGELTLGSTRSGSAVRREGRTGSARENAGFVWRAVRRDGGEVRHFRAA